MKIRKYVSSHLSITPILFSWSFIVTLFLANIGQLQIKMIIIPLITVTIFAILASLLFKLLFDNRAKEQIFTSLFIIMFFSFGEIFPLLRNFHISIGTFYFGSHDILLSIFIVIIVLLFFLVKRVTKRQISLNKFLFITSLTATLLPLILLSAYLIKERVQSPPNSPLVIPALNSKFLKNKKLPDIYYIVPEDYSSADIFQKYFRTDISDFTAFLVKKGFYVAEKSTSNYPKSFLSIASSLNMEYLDYLSKFNNSSDEIKVFSLIENNNVMKFLKTVGYKYYQMGSWWYPTTYNPLADENFTLERKNLAGINEFNYIVLKSTMLSPFIGKIIPDSVIGESDADKRARVLYQFEELPKVAKIPGPKFVFLHIISPHGPYVFDQDCNFVNYSKTKDKPEEVNYSNQTICFNEKMKVAVNDILSHSSIPPIILIQTDEGAPFLSGRVKPDDNWKEASQDLLNEKFPIFSAYYLPGVSSELLYPSITPVNSFRIIFNLYFPANLPLLPDKNYIFLDSKHLYNFKEVTDQVKS